jgi:hypothetical protein
MRETILKGGRDEGSHTVRTDDAGTLVLDNEGRAIETYGTDRHDEMVERHLVAGWRLAGEATLRPRSAGDGAPGAPDDGAAVVRTDQEDG